MQNDSLLSLIRDLRSPQLLEGGSQSIGSGLQVEKTEHGNQGDDEISNLEGLSPHLQVKK